MRSTKIGLSCIALLLAGCASQPSGPHSAANQASGVRGNWTVERDDSALEAGAVPAYQQVVVIDETAPELVVTPPVAPVQEKEDVPHSPEDLIRVVLSEAAAAEYAGDFPTMIERLVVAAEQGSGAGHYALAKHYTRGITVARDLVKAEVHLAEAERLEHPEALRVSGWKLVLGSDRPRDIPAGVKKLERAAETSPRAMRELGLLNLGVLQPDLQNPSKGRALLERANAAGDADAAYYLSRELAKEGDEGAAEAALQVGIERRSARAMMHLAERRLKGSEPDAAAAELLREAAMTGDAQAMYAYATHVRAGKIGSADPDFDTLLWLSLAAERQHRLAIAEMQRPKATGGVDQEQSGRLAEEKAALNEWIRKSRVLAEDS